MERKRKNRLLKVEMSYDEKGLKKIKIKNGKKNVDPNGSIKCLRIEHLATYDRPTDRSIEH